MCRNSWLITVESHLRALGSLDLISKSKYFVILLSERRNQCQQTAADENKNRQFHVSMKVRHTCPKLGQEVSRDIIFVRVLVALDFVL